jgi:hypothetical protein
MLRHAARGWAACLVLGLAGAAALPAPARSDSGPPPGPRWSIGTGPEVFRPAERVLTTRVGGWFDASYEDNDLSDSTRSLNLNHANVFLDTRYTERWQLFAEFEFEHESDLGGYEAESEYEVEQLYGRYRWSDALGLRAGVFNTPFGIWTPLHWTILMDTIQAPLHEGLRVIPEQQSGLELAGQRLLQGLPGHDAELHYSVFVGYVNQTALFDASDTDGTSVGADLRLVVDDAWLLGASIYRQERDLARDRVERSLALYAQAPLGSRLRVRTEYVHQARDRHTRPGFARDVDLAYAELRWQLPWTAYLNYRFNWGDDDSEEEKRPTQKHYIHSFTLGFEPREGLRLKLEYADHELRHGPRRSFRYWGASIGYLF